MSDDNKIIFAKNLKYYMDTKNIDRNKLCEDLGFKYSTVSEWLAANKYPRIDKIEKIASYFGISKSEIIEEISKPIAARPLPQVYTCKYYHSVSAGIGTNAGEDSDTYSYFFHSQSQADHCFAVDIEGDSMTPELHDGDIAIVDTEAEPQSGDIVVFYDKADDLGYIKQYHRSDDVVMFISFNTAYKPIIYPLSALGDRVKIWGRVIKSLRDF